VKIVIFKTKRLLRKLPSGLFTLGMMSVQSTCSKKESEDEMFESLRGLTYLNLTRVLLLR